MLVCLRGSLPAPAMLQVEVSSSKQQLGGICVGFHRPSGRVRCLPVPAIQLLCFVAAVTRLQRTLCAQYSGHWSMVVTHCSYESLLPALMVCCCRPAAPTDPGAVAPACPLLLLQVAADNAVACRLYQRSGYTVVKRTDSGACHCMASQVFKWFLGHPGGCLAGGWGWVGGRAGWRACAGGLAGWCAEHANSRPWDHGHQTGVLTVVTTWCPCLQCGSRCASLCPCLTT